MVDNLTLVGTAFISVLGALVSAFFAQRLARSARLDQADELALRFREPLLQAAFNLQSRLFNILQLDFLGLFLTSDRATDDEREYAVCNTVYLLAQYLGWVEVIRRESQYMDPRSRQHNREIADRLEKVREGISDSRILTDPVLRLFRGEQRAIGEVMLRATNPVTPGVPRWECTGYAEFLDARHAERLSRWFPRLEADVEVLGKDLESHRDRAIRIQRDLVDLVDVLDPDAERIPGRMRQRL